MVTFIVIRHGLSQTNKERRFTGQLDIPLDKVGVLQAECTGKYIAENLGLIKSIPVTCAVPIILQSLLRTHLGLI